MRSNKPIIYYNNGYVTKVSPDPLKPYYEAREAINEATCIVSDGIMYDLTDRESIYSIAVPHYIDSDGGTMGITRYLDYVLRMHASILWGNDDYTLAMACLGKANQLMLFSPWGWRRKDYFRIVYWNIELGNFYKADEWRQWIENNTLSSDEEWILYFNRERDACYELGTDLMLVEGSNACCEICAKYRNRVFSLSGRDYRFPKFPDDFHFSCGLPLSPFIYGVTQTNFNCKNIERYSRRRFKDDRTKAEKENYVVWKERVDKEESLEVTPNIGHIIYHWYKPLFPDIFPKNLSAFSRMRNSNSKKYQEIISIIKKHGYRVPDTVDDVKAWDAERHSN